MAVELIGPMFLMDQLRVRGDIDAIELAIRMEGAYMRPHVGALPEVMLAIRTLESLGRSALVLVMPYHVATMLVTAKTFRARMPIPCVVIAGLLRTTL